MPYVYKRRFLDKQYRIQNDADIVMIGESPVVVDTDGDITNKESVLNGSKGLWELLTCKNVNTELINKNDLKTNKKILMMPNAHLTKYRPDSNINIMQGKNFGIS